MTPPPAAGPERWPTGRRLLVTLIVTATLLAGLGVLVTLLTSRQESSSPNFERSVPPVRQVIPDGSADRDNPPRP